MDDRNPYESPEHTGEPPPIEDPPPFSNFKIRDLLLSVFMTIGLFILGGCVLAFVIYLVIEPALVRPNATPARPTPSAS